MKASRFAALLFVGCATRATVAGDASPPTDSSVADSAAPDVGAAPVDAGRDSSARDAAPDSAPVDASRPPLTSECQKRVSLLSAASVIGLTFGLDDVHVVQPSPITVTAGTQTPDHRAPDYASDILRATTPQGPGTMILSWAPSWTPPDLSFTTSRYWARRELVSCDILLPNGVREPGSAGLTRVDDSMGNLLFLSSLTAVQAGVVKLPAEVPLPAGLTIGTAVDGSDPCPFGGLALNVRGSDGDHVVRLGEATDFTLGATAYKALLWASAGEPATGNVCGQVVFLVFKKGLFVPPAN